MNNIPPGFNSEGKYNGSDDPEFGHDFTEKEKDFKFLAWCADKEKERKKHIERGQNVADYDLIKGKIRYVKPM